MSEIVFVHLSVRNFNSWKYLEFPLKAQGVVCLRGLTGSGKSSVFKAIYWCLFGSMPDAIRADEVRGSREPTSVALKLHKGGHTYKIVRHRGHPILKNKVEFEGYGIPKTDEDSLIKDVQILIDNFFGVSPAVFLTTTFFAQRNFHIFHSLSDTGKKEWLESITYGSLFPACEEIVRGKVRELERNISHAEGKLSGLQDSLEAIENSNALKKDDLLAKTDKLKKQEKVLLTKKDTLTTDLQPLDSIPTKFYQVHDKVLEADIKLKEAQTNLNTALNMPEKCPTCSAKISSQTIQNMQEAAETHVQTASLYLAECKIRQRKIKEKFTLYEDLQIAIDDIEQEIKSIRRDTHAINDELSRLDSSPELNQAIQDTKKHLKNYSLKLDYFKFWMHGFGFQGLRTYVLQTAATLLLARLKSYLIQLVGDKIQVDLEFVKNRIILSFNNRSYGALSGGERQAVDICTGFALRDIAENYNKCRFNLMVLDEPFEGLDEYLTTKAQTLLLDNPKDSTFFVTHRTINTRFDKYVVVSKEKHSKMKVVYG